MEHITGYVDHIIFQNADNGYTVLELMTDGTMTTCVGTLMGLTDGMNVELEGEYTEQHIMWRKSRRMSWRSSGI